MSFAELRLNEPLLRAVRAAGYDQATPIQARAIPHVLAGRDILGSAQTGTGKTAAFALPLLQRLGAHLAGPREPGRDRNPNGRPPAGRIRALVLAPTRELAQQIHDSFSTYGRYTGMRQTVVFGGVNQNRQTRALKAGVEILVATPGRLIDLMEQGFVDLSAVEIFVLDEADRLLDMGFMPAIRRIVAKLPRERQSLLFSATMPSPIRTLANQILRDPVPVQVDPVSSAAPSVEHQLYHVEKQQKAALLAKLLGRLAYSRALIFTRTKHGADKLVRFLEQSAVSSAAIHGNKSQGARTRALAEFRSGRTPILVATDIAARGLDVDDISHVFNFDLTHEPETFVHRIGRTGRAGATGMAVSFCSSEERDNLRGIERLLGAALPLADDSGPVPQASKPQSRPAPPRTASPRPHAPVSRPVRSGFGGSGGPSRRRRFGPQRRRTSAMSTI